jgi:hypothetical protein
VYLECGELHECDTDAVALRKFMVEWSVSKSSRLRDVCYFGLYSTKLTIPEERLHTNDAACGTGEEIKVWSHDTRLGYIPNSASINTPFGEVRKNGAGD